MESNMTVAAPRGTASTPYKRLVSQSRAALEALMVGGETPSLHALIGYEYRGYNVAPALALLGIRKFIKAFFTAPNGAEGPEPAKEGRRYGCNTPVVQNGLHGLWRAKPSEAAPRRYAFFSVEPVDPESRDNAYLHALLLDYGQGGNKPYDPSRQLRDYLVRCVPGSDDLLLGKAYTALGPWRIPATFFLLERHRPLPGPIALPRPGADGA
jgi:hypothetical protein